MTSQTRIPSPARFSYLLAALLCSACASVPQENKADAEQYIRVENQNQFQIRAYAAFESSPGTRVLLGTIEAYRSEIYPLPGALKGHRAIVVRCEKGYPGRYVRANEYFETTYVSLPFFSTLVVRIRDPIRYSDFTISSAE
jgi:hypothetical protein